MTETIDLSTENLDVDAVFNDVDMSMARAIAEQYLGGVIITREQVNSAALTMAWILAHPDQHDQWSWVSTKDADTGTEVLPNQVSCGTAACFAGWHALLNHHTVVMTSYWSAAWSVVEDDKPIDDLDSIADWAARTLNLPYYDAGGPHMFAPTNSTVTLCTWVAAMDVRCRQLEHAAGQSPAVVAIDDDHPDFSEDI